MTIAGIEDLSAGVEEIDHKIEHSQFAVKSGDTEAALSRGVPASAVRTSYAGVRDHIRKTDKALGHS